VDLSRDTTISGAIFIMKRCDHAYWLSLCFQGKETCLLVSDRLSNIINHIPNPDIQRPSLFVLISNTAKSVALQEIFDVKRSRWFTTKRSADEIHLHIDPFSTFHGRSLLVADGYFPSKSLRSKIFTDKYHKITRRTIRRSSEDFSLDQIANGIYLQLLFPFVDIFCFFADDLDNFKQIVCYLAVWLE